MRGQGQWEVAVALDFSKTLIRRVKEINRDFEGDRSSSYYKEVAEMTLGLINDTYEDVDEALPDEEAQDG